VNGPTGTSSWRSSPRRRRQIVWFAVTAAAVVAVVAAAFLLPNQSGHKQPKPVWGPGGDDTFHRVLGIVFALFLLAILYCLVRFLWRLVRGDVERAGTEGGA
jgi:hypothetical protein